MENTSQQFYSIKEASKYLNISNEYLLELVSRGVIYMSYYDTDEQRYFLVLNKNEIQNVIIKKIPMIEVTYGLHCLNNGYYLAYDDICETREEMQERETELTKLDDHDIVFFSPPEEVMFNSLMLSKAELDRFKKLQSKLPGGVYDIDDKSRTVYKNDISYNLTPAQYSVFKVYLNKHNNHQSGKCPSPELNEQNALEEADTESITKNERRLADTFKSRKDAFENLFERTLPRVYKLKE